MGYGNASHCKRLPVIVAVKIRNEPGPHDSSHTFPARQQGASEAVIEELLPAGVVGATSRSDEQQEPLFPEEAALVARAIPARQREFATGRSCARRALRRLQVADVPILSGRRREPLWPAGIVGSITHCTGYRAAAVARASDAAAIGIDAEQHAPLPAGVLERISLAEERSWLATAPAGLHWDRLLFSAKESVLKACFTLLQRAPVFSQLLLQFDPGRAAFLAQLLMERESAPLPHHLQGRYLVRDGLIVTAVIVPTGRPV